MMMMTSNEHIVAARTAPKTNNLIGSLIKLISFVVLLLINYCLSSLNCVNAITWEIKSSLTKDQLIAYDREATKFYRTDYWQLDKFGNVSYEDQLYASLKFTRHAFVMQPYELRYSDHKNVHLFEDKRVNLAKCNRQMNYLTEQIAKSKRPKLSLVNFLETGGHPVSSVLNGNFVWHGSYKACSRASVLAGNEQAPEVIRGRYCYAHLKSRNWPERDLVHGDRLTLRVGVCLPDTCHTRSFIESPPSSSNNSFKNRLQFWVRKNLRPPFDDDPFIVSYLYCLPDEESPARQWPFEAKLFFLTLFGFLVLVLYSTMKYRRRPSQVLSIKNSKPKHDENEVYESKTSSKLEKKQQLITEDKKKATSGPGYRIEYSIYKAFSLVRNCRNLFDQRPNTEAQLSKQHQNLSGESDLDDNLRKPAQNSINNKTDASQNNKKSQPESTGNKINLEVFNGMKVFATFLIIFGHVFLLFHPLWKDPRYLDDRVEEWQITMLLNSFHSVSLFFTMSSCLATYWIISRIEARKEPLDGFAYVKYWLNMILGRYLRLMPLYLMTVWFAKHVAPYVISGPTFMDYRTDHETPRWHCHNEPWSTILLFQKYREIPDGCVGQDWHIKADFKLFLILPIFIYLLIKKPMAGYFAIAATIMANVYISTSMIAAIPCQLVEIFNWDVHSMGNLMNRLTPTYTSIPYRINAYLLGVLLGYFLHLYEKGVIKRLPDSFCRYGFYGASLFGIFLYYGNRSLTWSIRNGLIGIKGENSHDLVATLAAISKASVETDFAIFLLLLTTNNVPSWITKILDNKAMQILSFLSYGVFLNHLEVIMKLPLIEIPAEFDILTIMTIGCIGISFTISLITHLLIEMPLNNLIKKLAKK